MITVSKVRFPEYLYIPINWVIMSGMYDMKVAPENILYSWYFQGLEYVLREGNIPLTFSKIRSGLKEFNLDKISFSSFTDTGKTQTILAS
jgi:hypothetical protein